MNKHTVTKEITFDCAHMLSNHNGACANLHGHTYKLQVGITGVPVGGSDATDSAMIVDFKELKRILKETVMDKYDHALIFSSSEFRSDAEAALWVWANKYKKAYYVLEGRTTAENMSRSILLDIQQHLDRLPNNLTVSYVRLWETPNSFAEYSSEGCMCGTYEGN